MSSSKLFCTFTDAEGLESVIQVINNRYEVFQKKIFILSLSEQNELICTYNIEMGNTFSLIDNTILIHRKKESNTLYTINALNDLIIELNGGFLDKNYRINWFDYRNTLILTRKNELLKFRTELKRVIKLN